MTRLSSLLATCFGIGRIPIAPGTFASAAALPFGALLVTGGPLVIVLAPVAATIIGVWACGRHATTFGISDPSECVLDEVAGQWIALVPLAFYDRAFDWRFYAIAFLLFRLFDVLKVWPLSAAERLPGGYGIMADDVLAGLIAAALLSAVLANGWI